MMYYDSNPFIQAQIKQLPQSIIGYNRTINEYNNSFNYIHFPTFSNNFYSSIGTILNSLKNNLSFSTCQLENWNNQMHTLKENFAFSMNKGFSSLISNSNVNLNCKYQSEKESSQASTERSLDVVDLFKDHFPLRQIGKYDWKNRLTKIVKYKLKKIRKMANKPIVSKYVGRSKVATVKARYRGRFIKTQDGNNKSS